MSHTNNLSCHFNRFVVEPYTPRIGAIIYGLDLSQQLDELTKQELKYALAQFEVIFFRDQILTPAQQLKFTQIFGHVSKVKAFFPRVSNYPEIEIVESTPAQPNAANSWHADITWCHNPPIGASLYAQITPYCGGDTIWASLTHIYDALSADFKTYLETLTAVHTWEMSSWNEYLLGKDVSGRRFKKTQVKFQPVEHPVVRIHPITGKKILYVNPTFTKYIKNLSYSQSEALLAQLFDLIKIPEYQARLRWQPNTLAVWDNRSTQHYVVNDYFPQHRRLHRITFSADKAF